MPDVELESLLSPLAGDAPCGADLEYDPAFLLLQESAAGKPEQQYGDTLIPPQDPDWPAVHAQALQLAARTRDLRVAVWLARSGARIEGLAGAVRGLQLVQGLVERHWEHVHPLLDASDHNDPTARMNALSPLAHASAGLADLRAASLTGKRGALTVRDIELALGHVAPLAGEAVPTEDGVLQGVTAALAEVPALAAQMQAGLDAVKGLASALEQRVPATQSPELAPLTKLMRRLAEVGRRACGEAPDPTASPPPLRRVRRAWVRSCRARTRSAHSTASPNGSSATSRATPRRC